MGRAERKPLRIPWTSVFKGVAVACGTATIATAQSFNVDFGYQNAPSAAYGGAGQQPGLWNLVDPMLGLPVALSDLSGAATSVIATPMVGGFVYEFDHPATTGDDQALLDDVHDIGVSAPDSWTFSGLENGTYQLVAYAWAPDTPSFLTDIEVAGGAAGVQTCGGSSWTGSHVAGNTYVVDTVQVTNNTIVVTATPNLGFASLNGIQLVKSNAAQSVHYAGFLHTSLGAAQLSVSGSPTSLWVGNMGSSGMDGVTVHTGATASLQIDTPELATAPIGSSLSADWIGIIGGTPAQLLGHTDLYRTSNGWGAFVSTFPTWVGDAPTLLFYRSGVLVDSVAMSGTTANLTFSAAPSGMDGGASILSPIGGAAGAPCTWPERKLLWCSKPLLGGPPSMCTYWSSVGPVWEHWLTPQDLADYSYCCGVAGGYLENDCRLPSLFGWEWLSANHISINGGAPIYADQIVVSVQLDVGLPILERVDLRGTNLGTLRIGGVQAGFGSVGISGLGAATLTLSGAQATVGNTGSSGANGVALHAGTSSSIHAEWTQLLATAGTATNSAYGQTNTTQGALLAQVERHVAGSEVRMDMSSALAQSNLWIEFEDAAGSVLWSGAASSSFPVRLDLSTAIAISSERYTIASNGGTFSYAADFSAPISARVASSWVADVSRVRMTQTAIPSFQFQWLERVECRFASVSGDPILGDADATAGAAVPTSYCTSGTTTNGCNARISATQHPSASLSTPCVITVDQVEGQKQGVIFYGVSGPHTSPWGATGSSFLCVKAPTQRTLVANSGGSVNACDGTLSLDWNAFQASNPGALGNPWTAGQDIHAQAWFRDPPAVKSTSLSDALHLIVQP